MELEPLSNDTRVQLIINKFKDLLLNGVFSPGSRLPPELELAKKLGVSRTPVREAMKVLQAVGVLEIKRGNGTYIAESITPNTIQPLIFNLVLKRGTPSELSELRLLFEESYIKLAARKRTEQDLRSLQDSLARMQALLLQERHDPELVTQEDLQFHYLLLHSTHNELVYEIGKVIMDLFAVTILTSHEKREVSQLAFENHRHIFECIDKRDVGNVESIVHESLLNWRTVVSKRHNSTSFSAKQTPIT